MVLVVSSHLYHRHAINMLLLLNFTIASLLLQKNTMNQLLVDDFADYTNIYESRSRLQRAP